MSPLLEVSDVSIRFPAGSRIAAQLSGQPPFIEAVAKVSFALEAGRTYALVGESGSGKTTLARAVVGLAPVSGGRIRFDGQPVSELGEAGYRAVRRDIAMIFQDPVGSLSPRRSVRSILSEPFRVHGVAVDLAAEVPRLLAEVGSSRMIARGRSTTARAIAMRWRCPPENSCG